MVTSWGAGSAVIIEMTARKYDAIHLLGFGKLFCLISGPLKFVGY